MINRIIEASLRKAGWELQKISKASRPTMAQGLKWLAENDIYISTVLDVGASNGGWSKICMDFFPNATYVLFEPQPVHSKPLDTFSRNCNQTIIPVKKAVGGSTGSTFFDASDPFGGALAENKAENTIKVELTTIDSSISELKTEGPYLLKLDTHGFERSILEGAENTLNHVEILIIEAYNYRITEEALLFWELCAYLSDRGFRPVDIVDTMHRQHDNSLWQMDIFFIRSSWEGFNHISYR